MPTFSSLIGKRLGEGVGSPRGVVLLGAWDRGGDPVISSSLLVPGVRVAGGLRRSVAARASSFSCPWSHLRALFDEASPEFSPGDLTLLVVPSDFPPTGLPGDWPLVLPNDLPPPGLSDDCPLLLPNDLPPCPPFARDVCFEVRGGGRWLGSVVAGVRGPGASEDGSVGPGVEIIGTGERNSFLLWCSASEMISLRKGAHSWCNPGVGGANSPMVGFRRGRRGVRSGPGAGRGPPGFG